MSTLGVEAETSRRPPILEADGDTLPETQALRRLVQETGQTSQWSSMLVKDQLRGTLDEDSDNYVYGEINIAAFSALLRHYAAPYGPEGVFYDLGCGAGKAVLAAALCPHIKVAIGVEILECTYDVASILAKMLEQEVLPSCRPGEDVRVAVFHDSIFNRADCISRADICFANCVTWPNDTMVQLSALAEGMKPGSIFLTCSVPLAAPGLVIVETRCVQFGWGTVTAYIQECMPFGAAWQSRRLLRPNGPPTDYLLDVPSLIAVGALSIGAAGASAASGALVRANEDEAVLVASCSRSAVPEGLVAHGMKQVSAFDSDAKLIAELLAAQEAGKGSPSAGPAPLVTYYVGDAVDPNLHAEFTHGVPARIPDDIPLWECLRPSAYSLILNQTILDVLMQSKTRTMDLAEEDFRKSGGADAAAEGADASSALGRMRGLGARLAHKALTSLCTALRPGGRLLLVARAAPEEALPALTSGFGLPWDVEHRDVVAVPSADPGAGPKAMHLYCCQKRPAESLRVSGNLVIAASHPAWEASSGCCSFAATGKAMFFQEMFECVSCGLEAVCAVCVATCHGGHDTKGMGQYGRFESSDGSTISRIESTDDEAEAATAGDAGDATTSGGEELPEATSAEAADDDVQVPDAEEEGTRGPLGCSGEGGWMARSERGARAISGGDWCTGFCDCGFSGLCLAGASLPGGGGS